jgi:hypothetical protein
MHAKRHSFVVSRRQWAKGAIGLATAAAMAVPAVALVGGAAGATTPSTTTIVSNTPNPTTPGQSVTIVADVTGTDPTGMVQFYASVNGASANALGSPVALVGSSNTNTATLVTTALPEAFANGDILYAQYSGDTNNSSSGDFSGSKVEVVAPPIVLADNGPNPSTAGSGVTFTATVFGTNPDGIVDFYYTPVAGGTTVLFASGSAAGSATKETVTVTVTDLPANTVGNPEWVINAFYLGDSDGNGPSNTASNTPIVLQTVNAGTLLTPTVSTVVDNASTGTAWTGGPAASTVYDTSSVTGSASAPTGKVTYNLYNTANCTGVPIATNVQTISGNNVPNSVDSSPLGSGSYGYVAAYSGDYEYAPTEGTCESFTVGVVAKVTPTVSTTVSTSSTTVGSQISDTATVTGGSSPTGTVTFNLYDNDTASGTPLYTDSGETLSNGSASSGDFTTTALGTDYWVATYNGDTRNNSASSDDADEPVVVGQATPTIMTTVTSTSVVVGNAISDSATVGGGDNPAGTVTFNLYNNANMTGTPLYTDAEEPLSNGSASSGEYTTEAVGTDYWVATYNGDTDNASVSSTDSGEPDAATQATPMLSTTASGPIVVGGIGGGASTISDKSTLSQGFAPSGTITFNLYGPSPTADCTTSIYSDVVTVSGNGDYSTSNGTDPGGFDPTTAGSYFWVASYSGDTNNKAITGANACGVAGETSVVNQVTPTLVTTDSSSSITLGSQISDSATLSGSHNAMGTITFNLYGPNNSGVDCSDNQITSFTQSMTALVNGDGTYPSGDYSPSEAGTYYWQAVYSGDTNNASVSSECDAMSNESVVVNQVTPSISTTASPSSTLVGSAISDAATVAGGDSPTGTVTFRLYNNPNGTGTPLFTSANIPLANGSATSGKYTTVTAGTDYWVATYNGDTNNASVSSGPADEPVLVGKAQPSVSTTPSTTSSATGTAISDAAIVTGGHSFATNDTVMFSLSQGSCTGPVVYLSTTAMTIFGAPNTVNYQGDASSGTFAPTAAGTYYWTARFSGDADNLTATSPCGSEVVTVTAPAPPAVLTPTSSALSGSTCAPFSQTFSAGSGYTYTLSPATPPAGLTFNGTTGVLSGTPTASATFTVIATKAGSPTVSRSYTLTVGLCINSGTTTLPNATHNVFYSTTLTGSGGKAPYRFEILSGGLPAGISLSSAGVISGTTGAPGTYHVTVEVLDSSSPVKTGTMALTLTVS